MIGTTPGTGTRRPLAPVPDGERGFLAVEIDARAWLPEVEGLDWTSAAEFTFTTADPPRRSGEGNRATVQRR